MKKIFNLFVVALAVCAIATSCKQPTAGNPIFPGNYADPEGLVFGDTYWVYPTYSAPFHVQLYLDCFSSKDLITWEKHERIIDNTRIKWLNNALWAPAALEKDGKYYLFFS